MNEVEAQQLCDSAISALSHGNINLGVFPRLIRRIIDEKAWLIRKLPGEGIVEMKSLAELVTTPPILGWGEDPAKIEAIIRDDVEVLAMWREAMKQQGGDRYNAKANHYNIMVRDDTCGIAQGTSRSYTVTRLQRQAPELFARVVNGELSANAAAILAGFKKVKTPLDQLRHWYGKASAQEKVQFLSEVNP